jgi:hypothetical protein
MQVGALERFLQPTAPVLLSDSECCSQGQQQQQLQQQHDTSAAPAAAVDGIKQGQLQAQHAPASSPLKRHPADAVDCTSDSPELLPLAARLQANKSKLGPVGTAAAAAATVTAGCTGMAPPAKKASTDRAKELLASPPTPSSQQCQQQHSNGTAHQAGAAGDGRLTAQFAALLDEAGVLSPVPQRQQAGSAAERPRPRSAAKELFAAAPSSSLQQQQQDVIELLDSPGDAGGLHKHLRAAGVLLKGGVGIEEDDDVVDLT